MFALKNYCLLLLFLVCLALPALAQVEAPVPDTTRLPVILKDTARVKTVRTRYVRNPARAAMLSAALPGMGQAYNRRYWKMPIVYAGFGTLAYFIRENNLLHSELDRALRLRLTNQPYTGDPRIEGITDVERLRFLRDRYRRNLEGTVLMTAGFYLLNIADAMIDAHLLEFNIIDDISMDVRPTVIPDGRGSLAGGLSLRLNLR
jgi:hypothetical protein